MGTPKEPLGLGDFLPRAGPGDAVARAGGALPAGVPVADEDTIVAALKTIHDPEIPVNIHDLGLIYRLDIGADGGVRIEMTLTASGCPVAGQMPHQVARAVADCAGVGEVEVRLVWEPAWTPDRMSDDARLALDF